MKRIGGSLASNLSGALVLELFHQIVDSGSARVRKLISDRELTSDVKFRNVAFDEPAAKLKSLGGAGTVPAL